MGFDDCGTKILGEFDPVSNTAYIDVSLANKDPRRAFTCGHEVGGHGVLQGEWLRSELKKLRGGSRIRTTPDSIDLATPDKFEQQANLFASHLLAPTWFLNFIIAQTYSLTRPIRYIGPSKYCLEVRGRSQNHDVGDFNELCRIIAYHIQCRFGWLSVEALSYRIEKCPFLLNLEEPSFRLRRTARKSRQPISVAFSQMASTLPPVAAF